MTVNRGPVSGLEGEYKTGEVESAGKVEGLTRGGYARLKLFRAGSIRIAQHSRSACQGFRHQVDQGWKEVSVADNLTTAPWSISIDIIGHEFSSTTDRVARMLLRRI